MVEFMDKYCERISPSLWSEPFNVISNIAYFIAAMYLLRLYKSRGEINFRKEWDIQCLILILFLMGVGSVLWHMFAQKWALYTDFIPITLFINVFIISCLHRVLSYSFILIVSVFLFYHGLNYGMQNLFEKDFLNGSIFYLPSWLFLVAVGLELRRRRDEMSVLFFSASLIFALGLFFRTIDLGACDDFSIGTHFIWHILTAIMMVKLVPTIMSSKSSVSSLGP